MKELTIWHRVQAKVRAKKFAKSIPTGMALKMGDSELEFLDAQSDGYVTAYMDQLKELATAVNHYKFGVLWERKN